MEKWADAERAVHDWVRELMGSYVRRARHRLSPSLRPSVVNDGLWGSIRLNPLERAIVDSPVIQRLRRIKQLGPALSVYPSARHTRFEHSLGALHRAATVMDALVASGSDAPAGSLLVDVASISPWKRAVRVAALLHDVGHVFLSHAGERILTNHGCPGLDLNVPDMLSAFSGELDCEKKPGLAEFFSFAVMTSDQLALLCEHHGLTVPGTSFVETKQVLRVLAGALVHARSIVPEQERWLCDVLSGPLDVDKQDYVPRDALMAGVGVQVEPHRCAEVLRVCNFHEARVLNETEPQITRGERRLTITFAGISVLEDLLLSRMSLFLRVYKHQKVRLIERLAERIFVLLSDLGELRLLLAGDGLSGVLGIADSIFYDGELLRRVRARVEEVSQAVTEREAAQERSIGDNLERLRRTLAGLRVCEELARMLAERDFPVRAFAYGKMFPSADRVSTKLSRERADDAWAALMTDAINPAKRTALEAEIVNVSIHLAELAGIAFSPEETALLKAAVCLDLPAPTTVDLAPVYVYAHSDSKDLVSYDELFKPSLWLEALQDSKIVCYVHAPRAHAHVVHAAAELVLAKRYGAMSQHLRTAYSRYNDVRLLELKEQICELHGNSRKDEVLEGLHLILKYPSFVRKADRDRAKRRFVATAASKSDADQLGRFERLFDQGGEQVGIIADLESSTRFCQALAGQTSEADVREKLLLELQSGLLAHVRDDRFGMRAIKTEGDAVVLVAALCPVSKDGSALVELLRFLADFRENRWPELFKELTKAEGWTEAAGATPVGIRVTLGRGEVDFKPQLDDILGRGATALFLHENSVKTWADNTGLAVLGSSDEIPETLVAKKLSLNHAKTGLVDAHAIRFEVAADPAHS